jgi:hypothetical protein
MWLASFTTKFRMNWLEKIQARIRLVSSVLSSMKIVKILGLPTKVGMKLEQARVVEMRVAGKCRLVSALTASIRSRTSPGVLTGIFPGCGEEVFAVEGDDGRGWGGAVRVEVHVYHGDVYTLRSEVVVLEGPWC